MTINIGLPPATGHRRQCRQHSPSSLILHLLFYGAIFLQMFCAASIFVAGQGQVEPAVRVVRFQVDYPEAQLDTVRKLPNWAAVMRKSVLASLRFVNKHWLICGEAREPDETTTSNAGQQPQQQDGGGKEKSGTDCGKLQVTGEPLGANRYRVNATFIASRDPVRNAKVEANSTVQSVLQIGLKGGIFQYTNAMKVLGKPSQEMVFEEAYFCYPGQEQADSGGDECKPSTTAKSIRQKKSAEPEGPLAPPPRPSS